MYTVKANKCFDNAFTLKYKSSQTYTVEADDSQLFTFLDDNITASDVAVVTVRYINGDTIDSIKTNHCIANGGLQVKVWNAGSTDATVTVNVAVL